MREERLKHVAEVYVSNVDKKSSEGDIPVSLCNYTDVYYNERITGSLDFMSATATRDQLAKFGLRRGDVVLTKDSETAEDIGVSALVAEDVRNLVCGYHLAVVRARTGRADGGYIRWMLASTAARERMSATATGVTRFGLRFEAIADLPVHLPLIGHQRAIAYYLDRETARIDALIAAKRRMVELAKEQLASHREHLLVTDEAVQWIPLHHLTDPSRPIVYGIVQAGEEFPGGVPYIKTGDLPELDPSNLSRTSPQIDEAYRRARVVPGDIVVAMRASIGTAVHVPLTLPTANLTQGTARVAPGKGVDGRWLLHAFRTRAVQEQCSVRAVGTTFKTLNIWDLRRVQIPTPDLVKCSSLAYQMDDRVAKHDRMAAVLERQATLLEERRQALITAAVTGQIDIPEAA